MKSSIFSAFAAMTAVLSFQSCAEQNQIKTFDRPVRLYDVESMHVFERNYPGVVSSETTSNLAFKMSGQLIRLDVEDGMSVKKGDFIAKIDPIDFKLQVDAARAAYVNSKSQLERYERLVEKQAISRQEYEGVQATYRRDKSNYENARTMLRETELYAPFSGIIEHCYVDNFQRVQASETVVRLIDPNALQIDFTLPDNNIKLLKANDVKFYVTFEAFPTTMFEAKIKKIVEASPDGTGIPVSVVIDDKSFNTTEYTVRPGFSATVTLKITNEERKDYTSVPLSALRSSLTGDKADSVWVYNPQDSTVSLRGITTGELFGTNRIAVTSGLEPGEKVVTAGVYQLVEGQKVRPLK